MVIVQVVGRLAAGFPISLLEFSTVIHAMYCFIMYGTWWTKPYEILEASLLETSTESSQKLFSWMLMQSDIGNLGIRPKICEEDILQEAVINQAYYKSACSNAIQDLVRRVP